MSSQVEKGQPGGKEVETVKETVKHEKPDIKAQTSSKGTAAVRQFDNLKTLLKN
jgi:hypothetical protein